MKKAFILVLILSILAGCSAPLPEFLDDTQTNSNDTTAPTRKPEPTKTTKPTKAPTVTPQFTEPEPVLDSVQFGITGPDIVLTYDTAKWEPGPPNMNPGQNGFHLYSLVYSDCLMNDLWAHGVDPNMWRKEEYDETYSGRELHFQLWFKTGTDYPGWALVKWGPGEEDILQIVSFDSGWNCFNDAKDVLMLSAERGFGY